MIVTALLLGLGGSLHCAGMCAPLAASVSFKKKSVWLNRFIYNAGRITTYAFLGYIVSAFGYLFPIVNYQQIFSISLGLMMIFIAIGWAKTKQIPVFTKVVLSFTQFLRKQFSFLLIRKNKLSTFLLGMLNGLLPCGLTYLALTYGFVTQPTDAIWFMVFFGMGTLPVMLGFSGIYSWIVMRFKISTYRLSMSLLLFFGVLLIARAFIHQPNPAQWSVPFVNEPVTCEK